MATGRRHRSSPLRSRTLRLPPALRASFLAAAVAFSFTALRGADCNGNGIDDRRDVRPQGFDYPNAGGPPLGPQPLRVLAADVDGDRDLDLITANQGIGDIFVLLNEGGEKFGRARSFAAGTFATDMAASDLDGDGDMDLVASTQGSIHTLLNEGDGTFKANGASPGAGLDSPLGIGDVDGDGDTDCAMKVGEEIMILRNPGTGAFEESGRFAVGAQPTSLEFADFDGDRDADLAIALPFEVALVTNDGEGTFSEARRIPVGANPTVLAAVDLDGDGDTDIAAANDLPGVAQNSVSILLNAGGGSFALPRNFGSVPDARSMEVADLDGDGDRDLVVGGPRADGMVAFLNDGRGAFLEKTDLASESTPDSAVLADLDGDGRVDLAVVSERRNTIWVYLNDEAFANALELTLGVGTDAEDLPVGNDPRAGIALDLDEDGRTDIAVSSHEHLMLFLTDGAGRGFRSQL